MKKKGLIVATIVMVLVLAVSITTATYAWFASTAQVTVAGLTITTNAAEGLQVAFLNGGFAAAPTNTNLQSGADMSYDNANDKWTGTEGWGSTVGLSNTQTASFAGMTNAVTVATADTKYPYIVETAGKVLTGCTKVFSADGLTELDNTAIAALEKDAIVQCTYEAGTYLVPIDYNKSTVEPISYKKAALNKDYLELPIVVQATSGNIAQIYYTVKITPRLGTNMSQDLYPGMAAASRIYLNGTELTQPFNDAVFSGSTMIQSETTTKYNAIATDGETWKKTSWIYSGFVYDKTAHSGEVCPAYTAQQFYLKIWIEGTDEQCKNLTAGSGFDIDISFGYVKNTEDLKGASDVGLGKDLTPATT